MKLGDKVKCRLMCAGSSRVGGQMWSVGTGVLWGSNGMKRTRVVFADGLSGYRWVLVAVLGSCCCNGGCCYFGVVVMSR